MIDSNLSKHECAPIIQLSNNKIIETIRQTPNLTDEERNLLSKQVISDDIEIRREALEKIAQSDIGYTDLSNIQGELAVLNKKGMYFKSKQTIKTGSGTVDIEIKGGDSRLIIPVLIIVGVVFIAILLIVFR
jgi:hypothetical protein